MTTHQLTARARAHQRTDTLVRAGSWAVLGTLALILAILCVSCGALGIGGSEKTIRVEAIRGSIETVCARHDAYIKADTRLSPEKAEVALNTSALLLQLVREADSANPKPVE